MPSGRCPVLHTDTGVMMGKDRNTLRKSLSNLVLCFFFWDGWTSWDTNCRPGVGGGEGLAGDLPGASVMVLGCGSPINGR
jgi:hypothetical protein